jgi:hypothetical protein
MKEVLRSSETSDPTRTKPRNIPEDTILHSHRRENLKSYMLDVTSCLRTRFRKMPLYNRHAFSPSFGSPARKVNRLNAFRPCMFLYGKGAETYRGWCTAELNFRRLQGQSFLKLVWGWRMASFGMLRRVALVRTDVSKELSASFIRVTRIGELGISSQLASAASYSQRCSHFTDSCHSENGGVTFFLNFDSYKSHTA